MPSYADEYAARNQQSQSVHNGPVRLIISRGDTRSDVPSKIAYQQNGEQEEEMNVEAIESMTRVTQRSNTQRKSPSENSLVISIRDIVSKCFDENGFAKGYATLLVLDTNVLMSTLPFIKALFEQCLEKAIRNLEDVSNTPSPFMLIVSRTILEELDRLKVSTRKEAATQARAANHWILDTLKAQKRQTYLTEIGGVSHRQIIPEQSWILHVENMKYAKAQEQARESPSPHSNDEKIISLCVSLKLEVKLDVCFCSDDTNASIIAEAEGLRSISFSNLIQDVNMDVESLRMRAEELIRQWMDQEESQTSNYTTSSNIDEDVEFDLGLTTSPLPQDVPRMRISQSSPSHDSRKTRSSTNKTTQDSIHAIIPSSRSSLAAPYSMRTRGTNSSPPRKAIREISREMYKRVSKHYPDDRSISSSIWAPHK